MGIETADAMLEAVLSEGPLPENWLTGEEYDRFLENCQKEAISLGEWAGMPVPILDHKLVLEPRYPFQGLNGLRLTFTDDVGEEETLCRDVSVESDSRPGKDEDRILAEALASSVDQAIASVAGQYGFTAAQVTSKELIHDALVDHLMETNSPYIQELRDDMAEMRKVNSWYSYSKGGTVTVWDVRGKRSAMFERDDACTGALDRLAFAVSTMCAGANAWSLDAELAAQAKLKELLPAQQYLAYITTGSFVEVSQLSQVRYMFRRCRPTIAISDNSEFTGGRVLAVLCLHPAGMYAGTFAGVLVPTDDVIAHLLMMRGDEKSFWKKANHHPIHQANSGL